MRRTTAVALAAFALVNRGLPATAQAFLPSEEARMLRLVNVVRVERELPPLRRVDGLVQAAREQSARMVSRQRIFHNPNLGSDLTRLGLDWHWSGENVGVGPDIDAIQKAFVSSSHHLDNIVRVNYDSLGVAVAPDRDGYVYVTQVFADLSGNRPNLPDPPPTQPPTAAPMATPRPAPPETSRPVIPDPVVIEGGVVWGGWLLAGLSGVWSLFGLGG